MDPPAPLLNEGGSLGRQLDLSRTGEEPAWSYVLRNVSGRTITGWTFTCVFGTSSGRSLTVSEGTDGYRWQVLEETGGASSSDRFAGHRSSGLLLPEDEVEIEAPGGRGAAAGPYSVRSCGPTAVIFDGNATWGDPGILERMFRRRRAELAETARLLRALEAGRRDLAAGSLEIEGLESLLLEAMPEGRWGIYREAVAAVLDGESAEEAAVELARLEALARAAHSAVARQVRPVDRTIEAVEGVSR